MHMVMTAMAQAQASSGESPA
jgi:hypothetical protein